MKNYDIIWIGTGQATGVVVPRLVRAGKTVAALEAKSVNGLIVDLLEKGAPQEKIKRLVDKRYPGDK